MASTSSTNGSTSNGSSISYYNNRFQMWGLGAGDGFDTSAMVDAELQILDLKNAPFTKKLATYQQEQGVWNDLQTSINDFMTTVKDLKDVTSSQRSVSLSDKSSFSVTSTDEAVAGNYAVSVQSLATYHKLLGDAQSSSTNALGYKGTVKINGTELAITENMSLSDIAQTINKGEYGANASIINNTLILTSKKTGEDNAIKLEDSSSSQVVKSGDSDSVSVQVTGEIAPENNTYDVVVKQLASVQSVTSNAIEDSSAKLGYSGSFNLNGVTFTVSEDDSVASVMEKINQDPTVGVTASLDSNKQLVFTGKETGSTHAFTLSDSTTNGTDTLFGHIGMVTSDGTFAHETSQAKDAMYTINGEEKTNASNTIKDIAGAELTLKKTSDQPVTVTLQGNGGGLLNQLGLVTSAGGYKNEIQKAQNAKFTIDGVQVVRDSNTVNDAIKGLTFTLTKESTSNISFGVTENYNNLKTKVSNFVTQFNKTIDYINKLTGKEGYLQGNMIPNQAKMVMSQMFLGKTDASIEYYQLGIEMDAIKKDGSIKLDDTKLTAMLEKNPAEILKLFSGDNGLLKQMSDKMSDITKDETGSIPLKIKGLGERVTQLNKEIDKNNEMLDKQKEAIINKYAAFETQMASLNLQNQFITAQIESLNWSNNK